jgi:hypothetical protein
MTDREPAVAALLERHTPPASAAPADWADVVARAAGAVPARRPARGLWIGLLAAALAIALAGSAFAHAGPGRILLRLVEGDQPAPAKIDRALQHVFHWPHGTHVLTSQSRLVLRLREPAEWNRSGITAWRTALSYFAPTADGGYCAGVLEGPNAYSYHCVHGPLRPAVRLESAELPAWRSRDGSLVYPPAVLDGTVPKATAAVTVMRAGGATRARISAATFPDFRYFAVPLSRADASAGHRPLALVAHAADGSVLARMRLAPGLLATRVQNAGPPPPVPAEPRVQVAFGVVTTPATSPRSGPMRLELGVIPARRLVECITVTPVGHPAGATEVCGAFRPGFAPTVDDNLGVHLAIGYAPAAARSMSVVLADGTTAPVRLHRHVYVAVLRNAWFRAGNLPARLVARDGRGRVIAAYAFRAHRDFPDY